jgi:hypothetical protein
MKRRHHLVIWLVIVAFVAYLAWSTVSAQKVECEVCVEFGGGRNCAAATAASENEAAQSAQTTACGPLARGMDATIACGNREPVVRKCHVN